jgi:cytochrome c2
LISPGLFLWQEQRWLELAGEETQGVDQGIEKGGATTMELTVFRSTKNLSRAFFLALLIMAVALQIARADDEPENSTAKFSAEAAATFNKRCTACHTYGKGIKVGPDLKGITERRKRDWLLKFIHASSTVIKAGDSTATALFAQFKQQRMPDWTDLSEKQINDILDYIVVGGPDIKPADERNAELATAADVENGRQLFNGEKHLKYGAQACVVCHSVNDAGWGGSLGPNLTKTYFQYQDRALTEFLRNPCFQSTTGASGAHYLSAQESFSLKAFLRQAALHRTARVHSSPTPNSAQRGDVPNHANQAALQNAEKGKGQ